MPNACANFYELPVRMGYHRNDLCAAANGSQYSFQMLKQVRDSAGLRSRIFKVLFCNHWLQFSGFFSCYNPPSTSAFQQKKTVSRSPLTPGGAPEIGGTCVGSVSRAGLRGDQEEIKKTAMEFRRNFFCLFFPHFFQRTSQPIIVDNCTVGGL